MNRDLTGRLTTLGIKKTKGFYFTRVECIKFQEKKNDTRNLNIYFDWTGCVISGQILASSGS